MNRVEEIKAELMSLLDLGSLDEVEIGFNTKSGRDRYLTVKGPEGKEEIWDTYTVEKVGELFREYYILNRDDTEDIDLEDQLWMS